MNAVVTTGPQSLVDIMGINTISECNDVSRTVK